MAININHQTNTVNGVSGLVLTTSNGANITLTASGGSVNVSTSLINNVVDPVQAQDAATKHYVDNQISALVNGADTLLDTLKELADALANDPNFAANIATSLVNLQKDLATEIENRQQGDADTLNSANTYTDTKVSTADNNALVYAIAFGG
jgi:hypothetical protein